MSSWTVVVMALMFVAASGLSPTQLKRLKIFVKFGAANQLAHLETTRNWHEAEKKHDVMLSHTYGFDRPLLHSILQELRILDNDGRVPRALADFAQHITLEAMMEPYFGAGHARSAKIAMTNFIEKSFAMNLENPIFRSFLSSLVREYPYMTWISSMQAKLNVGLEKHPCLSSDDLPAAIRRTVHQMLVLDGLTRLCYTHPTTFMAKLEAMYQAYMDDGKRLDFSGQDFFFLVKFPSVLVPIHEYIRAKSELALVEVAHGEEDMDVDFDDSEGPSEEKAPALRLEESQKPYDILRRFSHLIVKNRPNKNVTDNTVSLEEEEGMLENMILKLMKRIISGDPTKALRMNIVEASIADMVVFSRPGAVEPVTWSRDQKLLVPPNKYPPATIAGYVLAADRMMGASPMESCDEDCLKTFKDGKFKFSQTRKWMELYNAWNMSIMMLSASVGDWLAKLMVPAVLEDKDSYIIRRTIALWLTLFRKAFMHHDHIHLNKCKFHYFTESNYVLSHLMGLETERFGLRYAHLWTRKQYKCTDCTEAFKAQKESHLWILGAIQKFRHVSKVTVNMSDRVKQFARAVTEPMLSVMRMMGYTLEVLQYGIF